LNITIQSTDTEALIRIERHDSEQFVDYAVTASLRGESVANSSVVLLHPQEFVHALRQFEITRSGTATLTGSEDFSLTVEPDGKMGHAWIDFHLARRLYAFSHQSGRGRTGQISLSGSFPVSGEFVRQLVQDFAELLKDEIHMG
jgi:hypothetical protein